jgi:hypothetical protein
VRPRAAASLVGACLALSACGSHRPRPVTAAEWKGVINDWLDDRRFEHRHSCAAVRAAVRHLPDDEAVFRDPRRALLRYAAKVC